MRNSWAGWLAFIVLASVIAVTSCQAWRTPDSLPAAGASL